MNEFDQFVKCRLRIQYYIRYADDFVIFSQDKKLLESVLSQIEDFLWERLRLQLHSDKVSITTLASGVDFLGWVHFPNHRVLRTSTKRRMIKRLTQTKKPETLTSYLGLLRHGNAYKIQKHVLGFEGRG